MSLADLELDPMVSIENPIDLANALGRWMLIVDAFGKPALGTDVPEDVYIRFERDRELLFIDTRVFTTLKLQETIRYWRQDGAYCGVLQKRLASGSGKVVRAVKAICFDLSEDPSARAEPIRPRRGRPLKVERFREAMAFVPKVENARDKVQESIEFLRAEFEDTEFWSHIQMIIDSAHAMLDEATRFATKGKKVGRKSAPRKSRLHVPEEERIHVKEIDKFLTANISKIHRIVRKVVKNEAGRPKVKFKDAKPDCDPDEWVARSEDVVNHLGNRTLQVTIPVALLRHDPELKNYRKDYRYVRQVYHKVGRATAYCAAFDMMRTPPN